MAKDWIKHVRHTHADKKATAWCGRQLPSTVWAFLDIDHATYSQLHRDRLVPCKKFVNAITKALRTQVDE